MYRIFLVEDDFGIAEPLCFALREEGYMVSHAISVQDTKRWLNERFDLAVLDISLPDGSGYDICKMLWQKGDIPVLFLSALDDEGHVVMGLDMGAVDYVTKPFRLRELLSRIRGILRRKSSKGNDELFLSAQEYRLLLFLMQHPDQVLSRDQIVQAIWDKGGDYINDNTLSVTVRRLREKIGDDRAERIVTVRGFGYKALS